MTALLFVLAAASGGLLRFASEYAIPPIGRAAFPRATFTVNVVGAFILGLVAHAPHDVRLVVGTGLCGALTTFSGVSLQAFRRVRAGATLSAANYLAITFTVGIALAALGIRLSSLIFG